MQTDSAFRATQEGLTIYQDAMFTTAAECGWLSQIFVGHGAEGVWDGTQGGLGLTGPAFW